MKPIECDPENFKILMEALTDAAEENNIPHDEFVAFAVEFPRLLLGDKFDEVVYLAKREK